MLLGSRFPKLISLLEEGQRIQPDILGSAIRVEFENILKARELKITWNEIAESLGFPGKGKLASASYSREKRRRAKKEKEVVPEKKKWTPAPKAKEEKKETSGLDRPTPAGGARLIAEQKPEDLFNKMPKM